MANKVYNGFIQIPEEILLNDNLRLSSKVLYGVLLKESFYFNNEELTNEKLNNYMKFKSTRDISRCLSELVENGFIINDKVGSKRFIKCLVLPTIIYNPKSKDNKEVYINKAVVNPKKAYLQGEVLFDKDNEKYYYYENNIYDVNGSRQPFLTKDNISEYSIYNGIKRL